MNLEQSVIEIGERLGQWGRFPKYALERRIDIFLTPFLKEFFSRSPEPSQAIQLVAPEFPILSRICDLAEAAGSARERLLQSVHARTINVDYLLYRGGTKPAWIFVELKTEDRSFSKDQLKRYLAAQTIGMDDLIRHIELRLLGKPGSPFHDKYLHLLSTIRAVEAAPDAEIEIVYLAPHCPKEIDATATWSRRPTEPRFHSLDAYLSAPTKHPELQAMVKGLLDALKRKADLPAE